MTTPVEEIREATRLMREQHGPEHVRHVFWNAVADWLDSVVTDAEDTGAESIYGPPVADFILGYDHPALIVARAYLGGQS